MRYVHLSVLALFGLNFYSGQILAAESKSHFLLSQNPTSSSSNDFYSSAERLVQEQINLIARIERAIAEPDPNQVRSVRGQITLHESAVERFVKRQYFYPKVLCGSTPTAPSNISAAGSDLTAAQVQVYCYLYAGSRVLLKLEPVLDRLLARRGESAFVGKLPLVSGERQIAPGVFMAPYRRPLLGQPATPFLTREPELPLPAPPLIGRTGKTAIANYVPPSQPAIKPPPEALTIINTAKGLLAQAISALPPETKFINPPENAAMIERYTYAVAPQEVEHHAEFLSPPQTGIVRILPPSAYSRPLNKLENRLQPSLAEKYPFPPLIADNGKFIPRLALQMVDEQIQIIPQGVDYGFMVDLGDVPIEKLDAKLPAIPTLTKEFFFNYQPPQQLEALQVERRRFLSGKNGYVHQGKAVLAQAPALLGNTYLVRVFQYQLPEIILGDRKVARSQRGKIDQLLQMESNDILLAFQPVRRHPDGSYTVLWRFLHQFDDPKITDLEQYLYLE